MGDRPNLRVVRGPLAVSHGLAHGPRNAPQRSHRGGCACPSQDCSRQDRRELRPPRGTRDHRAHPEPRESWPHGECVSPRFSLADRQFVVGMGSHDRGSCNERRATSPQQPCSRARLGGYASADRAEGDRRTQKRRLPQPAHTAQRQPRRLEIGPTMRIATRAVLRQAPPGEADVREPASRRAKTAIATEWSGRRDLNSGPLAPEASALPACATPRRCLQSTPCPLRQCAGYR